MVNIKLLFLILDEGNSKRATYILNRYNVKVKTVTKASGTATPSVLDYFGLTETKKEIYMAVIADDDTEKILNKLNKEFHLKNEGTGVAFTIPISSSNKFLAQNFSGQSAEKETKEMKDDNKLKQHLVITIVAEGYLEQVMNAAKKAGCHGGTVIQGRGLAANMTSKVLGFNIEPEKDIVLNIVDEKKKTPVMESISQAVGIKTKGKGVCFSLPVADTIGLDMYD